MSYKFTSADRQAFVETATRLGVDPADLIMATGYETAGSMDPDIRGGAHGAYRGAIQFGPTERKQYGYKPGMSLAEQVRGPVYNYLKDRGLKPGMGLAHIYSIINAGSLTRDGQPRWNARDQNGTVREHVQRITQQYMGKGNNPAGLTPPLNVGQTAQGKQMPLGRGRGQIHSGPEVAQLAGQLGSLGYNTGTPSDRFGPQTQAAVRQFERGSGGFLNVDKGVAGPQVRGTLADIGRTADINDVRALAPGGPAGADVNPMDIAFGRAQAQMPRDVSPVAGGPAPGSAPLASSDYTTGVPGRTGIGIREGGAPSALDYAGNRTYAAGQSPPRFFAGPGAGELSPPGDMLPAAPGGPSYDTIYSLNSRIDPTMGSGQDASDQAIRAALPGAVERAAAAKAGSMSYPSMIAGRPDYPAPNSPSNSTGINGVLAGIGGIPNAIFGPGGPIMNASQALNGWIGGGSEPAAAAPDASISGSGSTDYLRGSAGPDFGAADLPPAGGEPAPLTPGGPGYVTMQQPRQMMDAAPAFFSSPPSLDVRSGGSSVDRAKQALSALTQSLSSGAGLSAPGQSGWSSGSSGSGSKSGGFAAAPYIYPGGPGGSVWSPSGYSAESHTPYINHTGETTVDQYGNKVNVGYYSMNGQTHQYTY